MIQATFQQPYESHYAPRRVIMAGENTATKIIDRVARKYDTTPQAILGKRRHIDLVNARYEVAKALYDKGWSYPRIGRAMNRDHTSIISLLRRGIK